MKCIKAALKPKSLINNYGFYIADSVIILYFISLFIFLKISYVKIKNEVNNIISNLNIKTNPIKKRKTIITRAMLNIRKKKKNINIFNYPNNDLVHLTDVKIEKIENNREQLNKVEPDSIDKVNPKQNIIIINEKNIRQDNKQKNDDIIIKKEDLELNSLNYEEAILLDHRNYCQYYFSLLKYNHPILFSFGPYNDYNSRIIKIFLFFYFLFFDLAINALFFTDDTMHKIYQDKDKFNIFYQIPQILYSTIISKIINSLIRNFALTQDDILALKQEKEIKKELELKHKNFLRRLKIKFII